jgi:hypothetical protein
MSDIQTLQLQLRRRQAELEAKAASNKLALGSGKMLGLGGLGSMAWMLVIGNPAAAAIIGGIAFVNYVAAAGAEAKSTGEFRPLLGRKNFTNLMMGLDKEAMSVEPLAAVEDDALYLNDRDLGEWILLHTSRPKCAEYLQQFPPEQRDEVVNLLAEEAYRGYGYLFRSSPDSRMQMRAEGVGQYAFAAVEDEAKFLRELSAEPSHALPPSQPQPTIGTNTRLTAVEAPVVQPVARAVEESVLLPEPDADFDWQPTVVKEPVVEIPVEPRLPRNGVKEPQFEDIAKLIVDDIYSYAIIGPSGSGKGMLWSHVVREARKKLPHLTTMLIDPKDFEPERGYAEGCFDIVHRTKFRKLSEAEQSEWLDEALNIYRDIEGHALLIFDEATLLFSFAANQDRKLLGRLKNLITVTASSGNAEERYVFLIGHSPNLGDYGISSGQMSSFKKIGIYPNNDLEKIKQIGLTTFAGGQFGEDKAREINRVAQKSPVGRAVYVGTRDSWLPMTRLQNYSSYDRDNRRVISQDQPTKPPCSTENQLQALAEAGDVPTWVGEPQAGAGQAGGDDSAGAGCNGGVERTELVT